MLGNLKRFLGVRAKRVSGEPTDLRIDADLLCCPVCFDLFTDPPLNLTCGHSFCKKCLDRLTGRHSGSEEEFQCPMCRAKMLKRQHFPRNYIVESILNSLDDWTNNEINCEHSEKNYERIAMKRLKQKVENLSSENSQLKRDLQVTKKRFMFQIIASSLMATIVAYVMHRFLI